MTDPRPLPAPGPAVKPRLTAGRRRRPVENDDYGQFVARILAAWSRRIAAGDLDALMQLGNLSGEVETALGRAVLGLRASGYSWAEIGFRLGVTRQAAHQRWSQGQP